MGVEVVSIPCLFNAKYKKKYQREMKNLRKRQNSKGKGTIKIIPAIPRSLYRPRLLSSRQSTQD